MFPMGSEFNLESEVREKENISPRVAWFVERIPRGREVLKDLYEYDAYTYIHVVQMLNEACILLDEHLDEIKEIGIPERYNDEEFKMVFMGAVLYHDWGKRGVEHSVLNAKKFKGNQWAEMQQHVIRGVERLIPEKLGNESSELHRDMARIAFSHHRNKFKRKIRKDYPEAAALEVKMPGYQEWFEGGGEEISELLSILDVNDAMRSRRSYKTSKSKAETWAALEDDFMEARKKDDEEYEKKGKYKNTKYYKICSIVFEKWQAMKDSEDYTFRRKLIEGDDDEEGAK